MKHTTKNSKIILETLLIEGTPPSSELAHVIITRMGLAPRKKDATQHLSRTLLAFYEHAKQANQTKDPRKAILTVDEMAMYAKISRQTMYEYLPRWLTLQIITKVSYISPDGGVIIGYKLNGTTLEDAFKKAKSVIAKHLDTTHLYISQLQKTIKNEKIAASHASKSEEFIE